MDPYGQRFDLCALEHQIQLFLRQLEVMLRRNAEFDQADIIMAGDNFGTGTGSQYALDTG
ncbi:hypothetical protein D3C76_1853570 [compost metagenome]